MKIALPKEMSILDKKAIEDYKIPSLLLMDAAARACTDNLIALKDIKVNNIIIFCGKGNNGGDGYAIARLISPICKSCIIIEMFDGACSSKDAEVYKTICQNQNIQIIKYTSLTDEILDNTHIVIDAVFGTGFSGKLENHVAHIFKKINDRQIFCLSVDIPSGLNGETGEVSEGTIRADVTVTFTFPKLGFYIKDAPGYVGKIIVADILLPTELVDSFKPSATLTDREFFLETLPKRGFNFHKGDCGKIGVVAGSVGLTGAAYMCCESALKTGSGLVTLYCPQCINNIMEIKLTECMTKPMPDINGALSKDAVLPLLEALNNSDFATIGPGLSRNQDIDEIVFYLIENLTVPMLLDADALFSLSKRTDILKKAKANTIISPHSNEMARLINKDAEYVENNRLKVAKDFALAYNTTVILKGHNTITASPNGDIFVNNTGNCGMATGGSGDVLCGIIASLVGQKCNILSAAAAAVYIHGVAGDVVAEKIGIYGMLPSDIINQIPIAIKRLSSSEEVF